MNLELKKIVDLFLIMGFIFLMTWLNHAARIDLANAHTYAAQAEVKWLKAITKRDDNRNELENIKVGPKCVGIFIEPSRAVLGKGWTIKNITIDNDRRTIEGWCPK